jgi:hypothetical protein
MTLEHYEQLIHELAVAYSENSRLDSQLADAQAENSRLRGEYADETEYQNVVQVYQVADGLWKARIGPSDGRGVERIHLSPTAALSALFRAITNGAWMFDPSWIPRP